jgi:hypothetical protein
MHTRLSHATFVVLALSSSAIAQSFSLDAAKPFSPALQQAPAPNPETYGSASEVAIAVSAFEFNPPASSITFAYAQGGKYVNNLSNGSLEAGVHFPAGASITRVEAQACNTNAALTGNFELFEIDTSNSANLLAQVTIGANTGCALFPLTLSPAHTVNNAINYYYLVWTNGNALDGSVRIQAARVFYKLQVSPPPATASFTDVPTTHLFFQYVEALAAAGITSGCGGGNFCPDAAVTRGQMAVFLAKALGLHWAP